MKTKQNYIATLALVVAGLAVTMTACQETGYPDPQPSTAGPNLTSSRALVVNASNASSITALFENVAAGGAIAPGANTGYVGVPLGSSQVRIKGAGGTLGTTDLTAKSTFLPSTNYTIFVTDTISRPKGTGTDLGGIRTLTVTDSLAAPAAGTAKVRFFNLASDVASASARLISSTGAAAATLNGRAYRAAAATSLVYTRIPAGTYTVQLYAASTAPAALTATPAASTTLTVGDGKTHTIYAQGLNRAKTLSVGTVNHN